MNIYLKCFCSRRVSVNKYSMHINITKIADRGLRVKKVSVLLYLYILRPFLLSPLEMKASFVTIFTSCIADIQTSNIFFAVVVKAWSLPLYLILLSSISCMSPIKPSLLWYWWLWIFCYQKVNTFHYNLSFGIWKSTQTKFKEIWSKIDLGAIS